MFIISDKDEKIKKKFNIETGYFEDGIPYTRMGDKPRVLISIEGLSGNHEPQFGFSLKMFIKNHNLCVFEISMMIISICNLIIHSYGIYVKRNFFNIFIFFIK